MKGPGKGLYQIQKNGVSQVSRETVSKDWHVRVFSSEFVFAVIFIFSYETPLKEDHNGYDAIEIIMGPRLS